MNRFPSARRPGRLKRALLWLLVRVRLREDNPAPLEPRELIEHLVEVLEHSAPGDLCLSGIIVALDLAFGLGGKPPESEQEMLDRLNHAQLIAAYGADICVDSDDIANARRYFHAVCVGREYRPSQEVAQGRPHLTVAGAS